MANLTVSQIVARAARELGKNPTGQGVNGAVSSDLTQAYNEVWKMLSRKGMITFGQSEDVPEEYCNPMVYLTANQRLSGVSADRYQRIKLEASNALGWLGSLKEGDWDNPTEVEDY